MYNLTNDTDSDGNYIAVFPIETENKVSLNQTSDSKILIISIQKKYQTPNIEMLIDSISQHLTETQNDQKIH